MVTKWASVYADCQVCHMSTRRHDAQQLFEWCVSECKNHWMARQPLKLECHNFPSSPLPPKKRVQGSILLFIRFHDEKNELFMKSTFMKWNVLEAEGIIHWVCTYWVDVGGEMVSWMFNSSCPPQVPSRFSTWEIGPSVNRLLIKSLAHISHHNSSGRTRINSGGQDYQRDEMLGRRIPQRKRSTAVNTKMCKCVFGRETGLWKPLEGGAPGNSGAEGHLPSALPKHRPALLSL